MSTEKYWAAYGSHLSQGQAERYGPRLSQLARTHCHYGLQPEDVVADAQKQRSPLREYFEWDDAIAGDLHRLSQARYLLRNVVYRIQDKERDKDVEVRAFFRVETVDKDGAKDARYASAAQVANNDEWRAQQVERARQELIRWRERWAIYSELQTLFATIDKELGVPI